jgi:DNA-binding transcriptional ArsR family regulator
MTAGFSPDHRDLEAPAATTSGRAPLLHRAARYARWDGTQTIPALDADEILDAMADDVMAEGDLAEALRRLMERGWRTSDPTRRDLVARLAAGDATVGELAEPYAISVQAVSKHLGVLADAGLVTKRRSAQRRPCHLEADVLDLTTKWIERYRRQAEERYQRLDQLLAATNEEQTS